VCAAGSVTNTLASVGATSCTLCSAGKYSSSSTQACLACSAGSTNVQSGAYSCVFVFSYTGIVQQWVVPANVASITVDAYGAAGGDFFDEFLTLVGGYGGYISVSNISASSFVNKTLFVIVGGSGAFNTAPGLGGGGGRVSGDTYNYTSGGGASDLRTSLSDLSSR